MFDAFSRIFVRRGSTSSTSAPASASSSDRSRELDPLAGTPVQEVVLNDSDGEGPHFPGQLPLTPISYSPPPYATYPFRNRERDNSLRLVLDPAAPAAADGPSTPLLTRKPSSSSRSHFQSGSTATLPGPSHVQWKTPVPTPTPTTASSSHTGATIVQGYFHQSTPTLSRVQTQTQAEGQGWGDSPQWQTPPWVGQRRQSGQNSPARSLNNVPTASSSAGPSAGHPLGISRSASSPTLAQPPPVGEVPVVVRADDPPARPPSIGRRSVRSVQRGVDSSYNTSEESDESDREASVRYTSQLGGYPHVLGGGLFSHGGGSGGGNGTGGGIGNWNGSSGSGSGTGTGTLAHSLPKPLSPIHEQQVPFPYHRKLSTDSVPRTPDSTRTFDRARPSRGWLPATASSAALNAFLHRPLKRSISQTSTSTHRSTVSAVPPVIPPLDLRPNFQTAVVANTSRSGSPVGSAPHTIALAPQPVPRKSRLPIPTLPTVVGSPRTANVNMVSVIYEDSGGPSARTSSFITAPSPASPSTPTSDVGTHRFSLGRELAAMYVDPSAIRASDGTGDTRETRATRETEETGETAMPTRPAGLEHYSPDPDAHLSLSARSLDSVGRPTSDVPSRRPGNPTPPSTHSRLSAPRDSFLLARVRPPSLAVPDGESFVEQRWLEVVALGAGKRFSIEIPRRRVPGAKGGAVEDGRGCAGPSYACVLFWLGFVMPWCWLVGGWLVSSSVSGAPAFGTRKHARSKSREEGAPLLPLWHGHKFKLPAIARKGRWRGSVDTAKTRDVMEEADADADAQSRTVVGTEAGHTTLRASKDSKATLLVPSAAPPASTHESRPEPEPTKKTATAGTHEHTAGHSVNGKSLYPLFAPSLESLVPPAAVKSDESSVRLQKCVPRARRAHRDPWVRRCRIAAACSGVLVFVAFVVAMVFVAGVRP
ncbi:uncharacterized protein BXZ73DRAFT_78404 [Epithele typhae]|uniref:uncharacterized protein n=1 Tax=Epithele typhae TaxID=378194 RepID=UPI002008A61D|nr:uncharacterized protein BXZ73DRAFT_78404 [Epithele typhae]KAH9927947.1 hypothetical protein BXZ73DRAFT_78404 [Epithele typhae]